MKRNFKTVKGKKVSANLTTWRPGISNINLKIKIIRVDRHNAKIEKKIQVLKAGTARIKAEIRERETRWDEMLEGLQEARIDYTKNLFNFGIETSKVEGFRMRSNGSLWWTN